MIPSWPSGATCSSSAGTSPTRRQDEREQLDRIAEVLARFPGAADGLLMPGHRPNDVVAVWLAAAREGRAGGIGAAGVYVCSSLKEEFGLALLEALASGLVVVGPAAGGPATYIDDGVTGVLVDTRRPDEVARAIKAAFELATRAGPGRQDEPGPGADRGRLHRPGDGRPAEHHLRRRCPDRRSLVTALPP